MKGVIKVKDGGKVALIGGRCSRCGKRFFPRRVYCPACGAEKVNEFEIGGTGIVYTYTVCHVAPPDAEVPYAIGYVDFDGVRVFGKFVNWQERLDIGKEVELIPWKEGVTEEGDELISYRFEVK